MSRKLSCFTNIALAFAFSASILACSDGDDAEPNSGGGDAGSDGGNDAGGDAGSDAAVECALQGDGTCPEGCAALKGFPYDDENACLLDEIVLACAANDGGDGAIGCYVHEETGTVYWTPALYYEGMEAYRSCTEDEKPDGFDTSAKCE